MPRKSGIDAVGALYHVIARGIERGKVFEDTSDKRNFLDRFRGILNDTETRCYARALIVNH